MGGKGEGGDDMVSSGFSCCNRFFGGFETTQPAFRQHQQTGAPANLNVALLVGTVDRAEAKVKSGDLVNHLEEIGRHRVVRHPSLVLLEAKAGLRRLRRLKHGRHLQL